MKRGMVGDEREARGETHSETDERPAERKESGHGRGNSRVRPFFKVYCRCSEVGVDVEGLDSGEC